MLFSKSRLFGDGWNDPAIRGRKLEQISVKSCGFLKALGEFLVRFTHIRPL